MRGFVQRLVALPAFVILCVCNIAPLGWMVGLLVSQPHVRAELKLTAFRFKLLARTLGFNLAAAILATLMGLPAAFVLGRGRGRFARLLWVLMPITLLLPSLAYVYGWSQVVRIIQPWTRAIGIDFTPNQPADIARCIWSLGSWLWAVPALLVGLSLRRMDPAVQEQAAIDGALHRVTLRGLAGPIMASLAIVTILATQEFAVYEPTGISVVATEVRMVFDTGSMSSSTNQISAAGLTGSGLGGPDQPARAAAAVAVSIPLLAITALLAILAARAASTHANESDTPSLSVWPRALDASRASTIGTAMLLVLNVGLPIGALAGSLSRRLSPVDLFSQVGPQAVGSILVALAAAVVALMTAISLAAYRRPGALALTGMTFLIGGQLLAIALIRIFNRPMLFAAYNCWVVPMIAYVGRFGWLAVAAGDSTWSRPWRELRAMASLDGAAPARIAWSIVLPLAWPALLAGGLLVGALSLTEVPATVLLVPQNPQVLTPTLMSWVHMVRYDPMIEGSLLMMGMLIVPALAGVMLAGMGRRVQAMIRAKE